MNALTFDGCESIINKVKEPAEVKVVKDKEGTLDIEIIDLPEWTHNGTLTFTETEIEVAIKTIFGVVKCKYAPGHSGILTGGAMATIDISGSYPIVGVGGLCGKGNAVVKGSYTVKSPEPLWVST